MTKDEVRIPARKQRDALAAADCESIDAVIQEKVCALPAYEQASVVMTYLAMGSEVETRRIVEDALSKGKTVALPRCEGPHTMVWYRIDSLDGLVTSRFGVDEPHPDTHERFVLGDERAIVIVPGLLFDAEGYRLGYGGGYYDAFLGDLPATATSVGVCRSSSYVDSLERLGVREPHDIPVECVVTEA